MKRLYQSYHPALAEQKAETKFSSSRVTESPAAHLYPCFPFYQFSKNHLLRVLKIIWWIKDEQVKREPNPLAAGPTLDSSFCPSSAHTDFDLGKRESLANILISADVCSAAAWHATATRPGSTWPLTRRYSATCGTRRLDCKALQSGSVQIISLVAFATQTAY